MDEADASIQVVPTCTPARLRDADVLEGEGQKSLLDDCNQDEDHSIEDRLKGVSSDTEESDEELIDTIDDFRRNTISKAAKVSASMPSPPTLRKTKKSIARFREEGQDMSPVSSSYSGMTGDNGIPGERTGTWYSEMIARCRSQLKEQEETLAPQSQQLSREKRDEVNSASGEFSAFKNRHHVFRFVL